MTRERRLGTRRAPRRPGRTSLREQALDLLRNAVTSGEIEPGTRLVETELSAALRSLAGTLREALRQLQQEGLVEAGERGRLTVRTLTDAEILDMFEVRAALEGLAAAIVSARRRTASRWSRSCSPRSTPWTRRAGPSTTWSRSTWTSIGCCASSPGTPPWYGPGRRWPDRSGCRSCSPAPTRPLTNMSVPRHQQAHRRHRHRRPGHRPNRGRRAHARGRAEPAQPQPSLNPADLNAASRRTRQAACARVARRRAGPSLVAADTAPVEHTCALPAARTLAAC